MDFQRYFVGMNLIAVEQRRHVVVLVAASEVSKLPIL